MTKRRTAERAVIEAAREWARVRVTWNPPDHHATLAATNLESAVRYLDKLDLDDPLAVRTTAIPLATSVQAAEYMSKHVNSVVGEVFREILSVFRQGAFGCTTDSLEVRLRRSHQSVSPRITDLRDCGWIEDSGMKRKTRSGQMAVVWKPTVAALEAVQHIPQWSWSA